MFFCFFCLFFWDIGYFCFGYVKKKRTVLEKNSCWQTYWISALNYYRNYKEIRKISKLWNTRTNTEIHHTWAGFWDFICGCWHDIFIVLCRICYCTEPTSAGATDDALGSWFSHSAVPRWGGHITDPLLLWLHTVTKTSHNYPD